MYAIVCVMFTILRLKSAGEILPSHTSASMTHVDYSRGLLRETNLAVSTIALPQQLTQTNFVVTRQFQGRGFLLEGVVPVGHPVNMLLLDDIFKWLSDSVPDALCQMSDGNSWGDEGD